MISNCLKETVSYLNLIWHVLVRNIIFKMWNMWRKQRFFKSCLWNLKKYLKLHVQCVHQFLWALFVIRPRFSKISVTWVVFCNSPNDLHLLRGHMTTKMFVKHLTSQILILLLQFIPLMRVRNGGVGETFLNENFCIIYIILKCFGIKGRFYWHQFCCWFK